MLPPARIVDAPPPPDPRGPVEVDPPARAGPGRLLDHEVTVQEHRLDPGQHRVVAVQVFPAHLHHAQIGTGEMMDGLAEQVGRRDEIGVEDGDELAAGRPHAVGQRPGLKPLPGRPVQVLDIMTLRGQTLAAGPGDLGRFIG